MAGMTLARFCPSRSMALVLAIMRVVAAVLEKRFDPVGETVLRHRDQAA